MNFKYACFDIGNVLCHVNFDKILAAISKEMNITKADVLYFLSRTQKLHDLGLTNLKDELHDHFKIHSEVIMQELLSAWNESVWHEPVMIQLLNELTENNVKIALLSNIGFEHANFLTKELSGNKSFRDAIHFFSCNVGTRKPSILYYQSFLMMHPKFQGAIYIDDVQENLDTGKIFGFKTVHFSLDSLTGKGPSVTQQNIKTAATQLKNLILKDK